MEHTIGVLPFRRPAMSNRTRLLQINVPCLLLSLRVLQVEGEDGAGLFDRVLLLGRVGEGGCDGIEGLGGGECVWYCCMREGSLEERTREGEEEAYRPSDPYCLFGE
jgi:hypothetical protein